MGHHEGEQFRAMEKPPIGSFIITDLFQRHGHHAVGFGR